MDVLIQRAQELAQQQATSYLPIKNRVAYVVSHGQSYASNGYAIRTQGIAKALNEHGLETLCFVRQGRPWDLAKDSTTDYEVVVDGVRYFHSDWPEKKPTNEVTMLELAVARFIELFSIYRPAAVLAASNYVVGLPAWVAARQLGIPFYNEVRGFWELSRDAREPGYANTAEFQLEASRDSFVAKQALKVFTLNQPMKTELVKRGVAADAIELVPNGVSKLPEIKPASPALKAKLGIAETDTVIGYIGSFNAYEGIDTLIEACELLVKQGVALKLLLVGDSQLLTDTTSSEAQEPARPWLIQTGRVAHTEIADYYALVDTVAIPRKKLAVCEIVPPMKAAEALAYGKRLVLSDVGPLLEYTGKFDGVASFEAGSSASLAVAIEASLKLPAAKPGKELLHLMQTEPMLSVLKQVGSLTEAAPIVPVEQVIDAMPLKRYSCQETLSTIVGVTDKTQTSVNQEIVLAPGQHLEIKQQVIAGNNYTLSVTCIASSANSKGAVADVTFLDEGGKPLPKPYQGMAKSKAFGAYFYIETQETDGSKPKNYRFTAPPSAVNVIVRLVAFDPNLDMKLAGDYRLVSTKDRVKERGEGSLYIDSFEKILQEAAAIPDSNGSEYFTKHDLRVGVIGDVYMYNFYKDVFTTVHYISPSNYSDVLVQGLDIVIYTTCWKGINNEEWRGVKFREKPKKALGAILAYAKENKIKTVFQTIEDPSNFDYFLPVAEKFDYVFTTDTDCIERYKQALGHNRVFFGEYGVNPQFNNPIGCRRNIRNAAFFAGSYPKRYKERCDDMEVIFDSVIEANGELLIADRNFGENSDNLVYPERFQPSVLPPVQHAVLQKLHKLFRYNLNFNSIKQSPTMCAMRVYELQAQGNGLISNYASSVFNKFPGIRIIPFKQDMSFDFETDESWEEYRLNVSNIREVLNTKTSYQVVGTLLENIGLGQRTRNKATIAVICNEKTASIVSAFEAQCYPDKVLLEESELQNWPQLKQQHDIGYFCWFSDENSYEKYYLNDLLNGFKYTDCRYITKNAYFDCNGDYISGSEHEYTTSCSGKSLSLFSCKHFEPNDLIAQQDTKSFELENGYSIDPFEINFVRYMQKRSSKNSSYKLSVIVPVYNNGRFLLTKCLPSLQRNKLWSQMEILLIDDGSTDIETGKTLDYLQSIYSNVRVKLNHDGGSGSASRPRNQGIDMATAPVITFLDPDNEIAPGAYDLLLQLYEEANQTESEPVEFISGFHVKVAEDVKVIGRHTPNRLSIIRDFKKGYFERGRFPVIATQSAVISKDFLNKYNLRFVEKSAGQDTLFGWELIANAKCGGFNANAYIIYYADRADSITNDVNKDYFEKKMILELKQVEFLKSNNLFDNYLEHHFDSFMKNWYLVKLSRTSKAEYEDSVSILSGICSLYGKSISDYVENHNL